MIGLLQIRRTLLRIGSTLLRYGNGKSPQRSPYQGPREIGLRNTTSSSSLDTIGPLLSPYRQSTLQRNDGLRDASYGDDLFIGGSSSSLDTIGPQRPPYRHPTTGGPSSNLRRIGLPINHENLQLLPYPSSTAIQSNGDLGNASFMTSPSENSPWNSLIEVQNDADKVAAVKAAVVIQQTADSLADMKRSWSPNRIHARNSR